MQLTDTDLIVAAYRMLLGREPDEEGMRTHLDARLAPEPLARSLMISPEYRARQTALKAVSLYGLEFVIPESELMYADGYERHVFGELMKRMLPGVTFLDVGANIGLFAVHAAKRGATVIAVEPKPGNTRLLLENARRNGVAIELHPLGASSEAGYAALELSENSNAGIRQPKVTSVGEEIIATQRIDTIVGNRTIDVVKIDIEGHEYKAMLGAQLLLSRCRPVLFTEYSSEFQRLGSGVDGRTYLNLLLGYGYRVSVLRQNSPEAIEPADIDSEWKKAETHIDLLFEPVRE